MVKLNAEFSATASNTLFISINDCTIDDVVLYGSNDETVKTTNIAVFSDLLTTITLYDNLSVEVDAFDTFELLEKFDEIIVMKNGIIVDSGKYDELINNNSIFKSLVEFSK